MSELNDPRVLFAAERTLLAWVRTVAGLLAMGFLIDRTALMVGGDGPGAVIAPWIGGAFLLCGVALSGLSMLQYRRSIAQLRPVEIPPGYWVWLAPLTSAAIGLLGLALTVHLFLG